MIWRTMNTGCLLGFIPDGKPVFHCHISFPLNMTSWYWFLHLHNCYSIILTERALELIEQVLRCKALS